MPKKTQQSKNGVDSALDSLLSKMLEIGTPHEFNLTIDRTANFPGETTITLVITLRDEVDEDSVFD